jgi:hypothetical protein
MNSVNKIAGNRVVGVCLAFLMLLCGGMNELMCAQQAVSGAEPAVVPRWVNFSGNTRDAQGKNLSGAIGVTFAIYREQQGGAPLWIETQSVQADPKGNYTAQLGATKPDGLPLDLFASGEARWMGVSINGGEEQPRVLLLSVPYALKAADAETVGGLPASAFVLAKTAAGEATSSNVAPAANSSSKPSQASSKTSSDVTTSGGTVNALPLFSTATNIQNSAITQTGSGTTSKIGINTTTPNATLYVNGSTTSNGTLTLPASGAASAMAGKDSQPQDFVASAFNSSTAASVPQKFQLQAEPSGNDTATPSGTLNLLYASGTNTPAETGLKIGAKGGITFAPGQTFPGTVTGVTAGTDLTGGGSGGNVTLNLNTAALNSTYPQLVANNYFAGNQFFQDGTLTAGIGASQSSTAAMVATGSDGHNISFYPSLASEDYNGIVKSGDAAIIYSWGTVGVGSLVIAPWDNATSGMRMGSDGTVSIVTALEMDNDAVLSMDADESNDIPFIVDGPVTDTGCYIDNEANLNCSGSKNAVVPVDDGKRWVTMSAIESPVNWFEDAGSARLVNGVAVVELDPTFIQTVNTAIDYKIFPVPNGDCKGLYVTNKTATSFEVRELGGGTSSVDFDYRIMAVRKNYETVRFRDRTRQMEKIRHRHQPVKPVGTKSPSLDPQKATQAAPARAALKPNLAAASSR